MQPIQGGPPTILLNGVTWGLYKWPHSWVTAVLTLLIRVITLFITGRGPLRRHDVATSGNSPVLPWNQAVYTEQKTACSVILLRNLPVELATSYLLLVPMICLPADFMQVQPFRCIEVCWLHIQKKLDHPHQPFKIEGILLGILSHIW